MTGTWGSLDKFKMKPGYQKDQGMIRELELLALSSRHLGREQSLEIEFNDQ